MKLRPKIKIELDRFDKLIEIVGVVVWVILIGLPIFYYNALPEIVPKHFSLSGEPDAFGGKEFIWTLPIIGSILYFGMAILNRYPHIFTYPRKITGENAERQYAVVTKVIRYLNVIIVCTSAYMTFVTVQTALGRQSGLGSYFTPIFMSFMFGTIGYYLYKSLKG